jgi:Methyltransferase domain
MTTECERVSQMKPKAVTPLHAGQPMKRLIGPTIRSCLRWIWKPVRACFKKMVLGLASPFAAALNRLVPGNEAFEAFSRHGFCLLRKHYYLPIPDETDLNDPLANDASDLVGIDMNESEALAFLQEVFPRYRDEFHALFPLHQGQGTAGFFLVNGGFMAGDAHVYYSLIRDVRPRRIVEIGGGNSSLLSAVACRRNLEDYGTKPHLTVIEPYPSDQLREGLPGLDVLLEQRLQTVDLGLFTSLTAGDILFIDSTHVLRPGNDVQREYCEILPRLAPGVLVHIHDISLPKPYFSVYFKNHLYWNEQYLLQAFLTYNSRFEVIWPGTYMYIKYPNEVLHAFPEIKIMRETFPLAEPSSFWLRVKDPVAQARAA